VILQEPVASGITTATLDVPSDVCEPSGQDTDSESESVGDQLAETCIAPTPLKAYLAVESGCSRTPVSVCGAGRTGAATVVGVVVFVVLVVLVVGAVNSVVDGAVATCPPSIVAPGFTTGVEVVGVTLLTGWVGGAAVVLVEVDGAVVGSPVAL
jgi:hypothetical protein